MWQFFFHLRWASLIRFNLVVYWVEPITILKAPTPTGQPTRSEEQKSSPPESTHLVQIAGPCTRRNLPAGGENELADGALTNDNGTPKPIPAVSRASAPASAPGPPERYTDEYLQRATKLALKSFVKDQEHGQLQANFEAKDSKM